MRLRELLREVGRNLLTGTTRVGTWAVLFLLLVGGLAAADVRTIVEIDAGAHAFREAGGAVQVLGAPGQIDGRRCEALAHLDGVTAVGALRVADPVTLAALPSFPVPVHEVTAGLPAVLGVVGDVVGVAIPHPLAETLGTGAGLARLSEGTVPIGAVYRYPEDGRATALGHTVLAPVPTTGGFDACWAEIWPTDAATSQTLRYALIDGADAASVTQRQLNSTLGQEYDTAALLDGRLTRWVPGVAALAGVLLAAGSVRRRRLELASARHAGVAAASLTLQTVVETVTWAAAATVIALPMLWWVAVEGNPGEPWPVWVLGVATVLVGALATVPAAAATCLLTRERHLFRYFKDH